MGIIKLIRKYFCCLYTQTKKSLSLLMRKYLIEPRNRRFIDRYNSLLPQKIKLLSNKSPIRVAFYVINVGMWKSDKLFQLLLNDHRFSPIIISYLYDFNSNDYNRKLQCEIEYFFKNKGYPYENGFDFKKNSLISLDSFDVDIIFFAQPYHNTIKQLPLKQMLAYIPYCYNMEDLPQFYNTIFQNVCWKLFCSSEMHKEIAKQYCYNKAANVVVVGNPIEDYFRDNSKPDESQWKQKNRIIKKIIWAPHHSILQNDTLDYSNFLEIADGMLKLASEYEGKVQFVFKPHPILKSKLYAYEGWGKERTDNYYNEWLIGHNTNFVDGNYVDLFKSSDAMIHDCSTFTCEYLLVNKPVMFVSKKETISQFNSFAKACFDVHYHGRSISDIELFINNVIEGRDPLLDKRTVFIQDSLSQRSGESVAERIYKELCTIFE